MATGAIASSGAWVPTLAVHQKTPNNNQKHQTQKRQGTWVPVPGCLYMRGPWVLIPGCSPDEAGGREEQRGPHQAGGGRPSCRSRSIKSAKEKPGDSWERRRAKHQALGANQMLHLRSCKRYAGREKVEASS